MGKKAKKLEENTFSQPLVLVLAIALALLQLVMYPFMADIYALPKATFLSIATLLLVFLYYRYAVTAERFILYRSPLDIPVLFFVVTGILTLVVSDQPLLGLIGKYRRYEGLPALLSFAAIYFVATQSIRDEKSFERLLKALAAGLVPILLYGIAQASGYDFAGVFLFERRIHSSLANPILLGAYLVILLPLLFSFAANSQEQNWRLLAWGLIPTGFAVLLLTESRGAWVGLVASVAAVYALRRPPGLAQLKKRTLRQNGRAFRMRLALIIASIVIALGVLAALLPSSGVGERVAATFSLSEGSTATRIETWKSALAMVADRPLSGFGLEQMGYWFPAYKTARHSALAPNGVADRTHNDVLQVAVDTGVVGLLLYLWILVLVGVTLYRERQASPYAVGLFAALIGYFAQAQTGITAVFIAPVTWTLFAAAMNLSRTGRAVEVRLAAWLGSAPVASVAGVVCVALVLLSLRPVVADIYMYKGQQSARGSFEMAAPSYESALSTYPYQTAYVKLATEFYLDYAAYAENAIFAQRAALIAEQGLAYNDRDFELTYYVGEASLLSFRFKDDPFALAKAQDYFERTEKLWPGLTFIDGKLLEVAILQGDNKKALVKARKMVDEGQKDPRAYYVLATDAQRRGDTETAEHYLGLLEEFGPGSLQRTESR